MDRNLIIEKVTLQELQEMFSNVIESKIESLKPAKQSGDEASMRLISDVEFYTLTLKYKGC